MLVDDVDGLLLVLCSATQALDLKQTVSAWVKREASSGRGVLSRPVSSAAEIPALHATLKRALGDALRKAVDSGRTTLIGAKIDATAYIDQFRAMWGKHRDAK